MISMLHRLKEDDEGQTLVLGAVSMLVLALCVMATLSIGQAAHEKIRLQNTADATAYSLAAVQARAFNFFAYSNRAMVAHYNSALTLVAYLSFMIYVQNTLGRLLDLLQYIPWLGAVAAFINTVVDLVVAALRLLVQFGLPIINLLNLAYFAFQLAMWGVMQTQLITNSAIASENDPDVITGIDLGNLNASSVMQGAIKVLNLYMVNKGIDYKAMLALVPTAGINSNFDNVKNTSGPKLKNAAGDDKGNEGRLVMSEIVNAGRHPWVAGSEDGVLGLGRRWGWTSPSILGFQFTIKKGARTEHSPTTGMGRDRGSRHDMIFSVEQFIIRIEVPLYWFQISYHTFVIADYKKGGEVEILNINDRSCPCILSSPWGGCAVREPICSAAKVAVAPLRLLLQGPFMGVLGLNILKKKNYYWFGITPFMKFAPSPKWRQAFNQPQFMVLASKPDDKLNRMNTTFQRKYALDFGLSGSATPNPRGADGSVDFSIDVTDGDSFVSSLAPGFNALSVARTYYHRPGEWKEHPNLFNPFWAAKLDPVAHHAFIGEVPHLANFGDEIILH